MTIKVPRPTTATPGGARAKAPVTPPTHETVRTVGGATVARSLAVLRLATGAIFLWAFLDKLVGFGYATPGERAWINGGSPTEGFLGGVSVGPFESMFHAMAGNWLVDTLFMLGLLGIGLALILGIGMRIAAVAGGIMMLGMWAAEWPLAQNTSAGEPSMSTNPLIESHVIYALVLIVLAVTYAGATWGFGKSWARLPFVQRNGWLS